MNGKHYVSATDEANAWRAKKRNKVHKMLKCITC